MRRVARRGAVGPLLGRLAAFWRAVRSLASEDAYERYCRHAAARHPGEPVMTRGDFWRAAEEAKWSGVSRCC
jgi:uncharacterized short protein YbdD (DUF466 family)